MIKITKDEAKHLVTCGVQFGDGGLAHTHGKYKHYFLAESYRNLSLLKKYRDGKKTK